MKIRTKLIGAFAILILLTVVVFFFSRYTMSGMNDRIDRMANVTAQKIKLGARINRDLIDVSRATNRMVLADNIEEMQSIEQYAKQKIDDIQLRKNELSQLSDQEGLMLLEEFDKKWQQYLNVYNSVSNLTLKNSNVRAQKLSGTKAFNSVNKMSQYLTRLYENTSQRGNSSAAYLALEIKMAISDLFMHQKNLIMEDNEMNMMSISNEIQSTTQRVDMLSSDLGSILSGQNKALFESFQLEFIIYKQIDESITELTLDNSNKKALELAKSTGKELHEEAVASVIKLVNLNENQLTIDKKESDDNFMTANFIMTAVILGSILIALGISYWIIPSISRSVTTAKRIAEGDLTMDLSKSRGGGDLDEALERMVNKLREVATGIRLGADNITAASSQISASSQQLAQGSQEQASSAEEASSSMEQMSAGIDKSKDNAQETNKMAIKAVEDINVSRKTVNETVQAINNIAERIAIIGEIASKTDLLALNAAVEAARAGEHGKGFAAVAAEVRKLAERSQNAAAEIDEISSSTVQKAEESGRLLNDVVPDIEKTAELISEISASAVEQASGSDQVNTAIQQLSSVTSQTASSSEELASSAEELNSQSETLKATAEFFRLPNLQNSTYSALSGNRKTGYRKPSEKKDKFKLAEPEGDDNGYELDMSQADNGNSENGNYSDDDFKSY